MTPEWRKLEYSLFEMSLLSDCSTNKAQECAQEVPHRASKAASNLRVQRFSEKPKNAIQPEIRNRISLKKIDECLSLGNVDIYLQIFISFDWIPIVEHENVGNDPAARLQLLFKLGFQSII